MNNVLWPYPCARPKMGTCWRYRSVSARNIAAIALQLRILWASLRWDDLNERPNPHAHTVTTDEAVTKKEFIKRREIGPYGLRSQFLVKEIVVPLFPVDEPVKRDYTPIRSGLRERRRVESPKLREPKQTERWVDEEKLELWEVKSYYEREDQKRAMIQECLKRKEEAKRPDEILTEQIKANELRQQRVDTQQKRLGVTSVVTSGANKENSERPWLVKSYLQDKGMRVVSGGPGVVKVSQVQSPSGVVTKLIQPKTGTPAAASVTVRNKPMVTIVSPGAAKNPPPVTTAKISNLTVARPDGAGGSTMQNLRIIQQTDGSIKVEGLLPGQQLVKLPDGKLQLINNIGPQSIAPKPAPATADTEQKPGTQSDVENQPAIKPNIQPAGTAGTKLVKMRTADGRIIVKRVPDTQDAAEPASQPQASAVATTPTTPKQQQPAAVQSQSPPKTLVQIQIEGQAARQVVVDNNQLTQLQTLAKTGKLTLTVLGHVQTKPSASPSTPANTTTISPAPVAQEPSPKSPPAVSGGTLVSTPKGLVLQKPAAQQVQGVQPQQSQQTVVKQQVTNQALISAVAAQLGGSGAQLPGGAVLVRTANGQLAVLRPGQPGAQLVQTGASTVASPHTSPPAGSAGDTVAPNVVQQMLQTAMQSSEDPEIQAKIAALQRQMGPGALVDSAPTSAKRRSLESRPLERATPSATGRNKARLSRSKEDTEERTVLTEKKEARAAAAARLSSSSGGGARAEGKKERSAATMLQRHKEALKQDMMRKRSLMEKQLQLDVGLNLKAALDHQNANNVDRKRKQPKTFESPSQAPTAPKKRRQSSESDMRMVAPQQVHTPALATTKVKVKQTPKATAKAQAQSTPKTNAKATSRRKTKAVHDAQMSSSPETESDENDVIPEMPPTSSEAMSARKRNKIASTSAAKARAKSANLYCICKMPYDETKFYVGCDLCSNWFHGSCIGISEKQAKKFDSYVCDDCKRAKENTEEELYCLCKQPYDDKQFYVGCDGCQDWFHATCVGISREEAEQLESYWCPNCDKNKQHEDQLNSRLLERHHWELLKQVWSNVKSHKMAWPFLEPVDADEVPDYYDVITNPMDLSTIKEKLDKRRYKKVGEFIKDMFLMFNNCRIYNDHDSPFYQCAEVLEIFFDKKQLKMIREKL